MFYPLIFGKITLGGIFFELSIAALLIVIFGIILTKYADIIANVSGLGGTWIGLTALATITSIPELAASLSSVTILKAPNLGLGNVYGSNAFNLLILVMLDFLQGPGPFTRQVKLSHILPAAQGIFLMGTGVMGIIACMVIPQYAGVISACATSVIAFAFLLGSRTLYRVEISEKSDGIEEDLVENVIKPKYLYMKFCLSALMLAGAGCWLSIVGDKLSTFPIPVGDSTMILGQSFVGTIFIAICTSLPETVVSITALKIGAIDMSVGNILGSNTFNMFIIFFMEIFSGSNGVLGSADKALLIPALIAITETSILTIGLIYRSTKSFLLLGWDNFAMLLIYLIGNWIFFQATVIRN